RPGCAAIIGVGGAGEVHLPQRLHPDVLQVGVGLGGRAVDGRLYPRVKADHVGEAAVGGRAYRRGALKRDDVVRRGFDAALVGDRRGGPACTGQAADEHAAGAAADRDDLAARVQRQAAAVVDDVVPHPQAALFRLTEVVGVEHPGDVAGQVDGDDAVVRVTAGGQVRRVDDRRVRLPGGRVVVVPRGVV